MRFVQVIQFRLKTYFIEQLGAAYSQQYKLRYFGSHVGIVQTVRDGLRNIIVFGNISAQ